MTHSEAFSIYMIEDGDWRGIHNRFYHFFLLLELQQDFLHGLKNLIFLEQPLLHFWLHNN
jgi:hypothetical protein